VDARRGAAHRLATAEQLSPEDKQWVAHWYTGFNRGGT
jgi:hypothetical protein